MSLAIGFCCENVLFKDTRMTEPAEEVTSSRKQWQEFWRSIAFTICLQWLNGSLSSRISSTISVKAWSNLEIVVWFPLGASKNFLFVYTVTRSFKATTLCLSQSRLQLQLNCSWTTVAQLLKCFLSLWNFSLEPLSVSHALLCFWKVLIVCHCENRLIFTATEGKLEDPWYRPVLIPVRCLEIYLPDSCDCRALAGQCCCKEHWRSACSGHLLMYNYLSDFTPARSCSRFVTRQPSGIN